jgi:phosphopantetheinyl transferase
VTGIAVPAELLLIDLTGIARDEGRRIAAALAARHAGGAHSWTRSQDVGAFAWSGEAPVGVDLECVREVTDWPRIAAEFLDGETRAAIWRADSPLDAFLAAWTRLECRGKAAGVGLAAPAPALPVQQFRFEHRGQRFVGAVTCGSGTPAPRWIERPVAA